MRVDCITTYFKRFTTNEEGKIELTFEAVDSEYRRAVMMASSLKELRQKDKPLILTAKIKRNIRSLNANAYFHVLVGEIAMALGQSESEVKRMLVFEYGTKMFDLSGQVAGLMVNHGINLTEKYAKWYETREEFGKLVDCYILYKPTHELDTAEMARLIDGAVYEAKELGIDTRTPDEIAKMMEEYDKRYEKQSKQSL